MSTIRFYDEAVIAYFKDKIKIDTGEGINSPQVTFALPSRQSFKLEISSSGTPILPLIAIIRTGLSPNAETKIVKKNIHRPMLFDISQNKKVYEGAELMPYNINYQVDYFSLTQEIHNQLTESILFNLYKHHYIRTFIDVANHNLVINGYIYDIASTDSTPYMEIPDTSTRIFHGTVTFSLYTMLIDPNYYTRSVINVEEEINADI